MAGDSSSNDDLIYGLPPVITVEQAAEFLGVDVKTVYSAIRAGDLPAGKLGRRRVLILRDALLEWLRSERRVPPGRRRK